MKIPLRVGAATLAAMLTGACLSPRPHMRLHHAGEAAVVLRPAIQQPIEVSEADFRTAMRALTADARNLQAPVPRRSFVSLASLDEQSQLLRREYLSWCQRSMGRSGDCLAILNGSMALDDGARQMLAIDIALSGAMEEAAESWGAITPLQLRVMVMSAMVGYMTLILIPEPISKLIAIVLTCNMIAYLGLDIFNSVVLGYSQMRQEAREARSMAELFQAGQRYGARLGPSVARLVVMLATFGVAKAAGMTPAGPPRLPGAMRAATIANAHGYSLAAVGEVQAVTRTVDGSVTLTLSGTVAMSSMTPTGAAAAPAKTTQTAKAGLIDPKAVRFSQDSIKSSFKGGPSIDELAEGLRSGTIKPSDVPAIRIFERDGNLFTLDNRRLEAFRRAGVKIPYRQATPEEVTNEAWKFTTRNGGESIRVRDE